MNAPDQPAELLRQAGLPTTASDDGPLRHIRSLPARHARDGSWPQWVPDDVRAGLAALGTHTLYTHQSEAAEHLHRGADTILATGTASGKSLATQLPGFAAICGAAPAEGIAAHPSGEAAVLYLSPTKALAADQLSALTRTAEAVGRSGPAGGIRPASYDGDTAADQRRWVRDHANIVLTNPDMLNIGILPNHRAWARFLARLRYVVIDEAHSCRGVFGSHIALLLRRLRRVCEHYGSSPVFAGASATSADPAGSFARLTGRPDPHAITADGSPHAAVDIYLWESTYSSMTGDHDAPLRRSLTVEAADMLTTLVLAGRRTLAFITSRRGAETIAQIASEHLAEVDMDLRGRIAAYRSGYLREERRDLEGSLRAGDLLGVASTPALELGIDISGLDAVIIAGWPGTRASFFQQLGRAGRAGQRGAAFFIAGDDPLDAYLLDHPESIFDVSVEDSVTDPGNPHVAAAHLLAAAQELPLTPADFDLFESSAELIASLTEQGYLRRRPRGWFFAYDDASAAEWVKLRSDGAGQFTIVHADDGNVIGDIGGAQVFSQAHPGAVYVHQGRSYVVEELDTEHQAVLATPATPPFYTQARETTSIEVIATERTVVWGDYTLHFGSVEVTSAVVGFQRKALGTSEVISDETLELPPSTLQTKAMWISAAATVLAAGGVVPEQVPGALHAAEHAMIGMLPLVASSDRWDIGGVSTALHRDTETPAIFVYDGHPGGAGFAERGFTAAQQWITATAATIRGCPCESGCPSCIQSPKCGNKNSPLEKVAALHLLEDLLAHARTPSAGL